MVDFVEDISSAPGRQTKKVNGILFDRGIEVLLFETVHDCGMRCEFPCALEFLNHKDLWTKNSKYWINVLPITNFPNTQVWQNSCLGQYSNDELHAMGDKEAFVEP
ncbi:hypothetical protein FGSG_13567 [Fusarium graminearum PH-1]|uniref:Chromosome 4, complete genome n=1 Tax=Gibberella zeae (strain ATCC MYA-4620 / CBS 123657 / FGSC 9075 / NRRL 31084 / PH-1) TaxID=229533 RepID=I1S9N6_GIBZE|nr:hypothetical protein FGSG_13567 [Fusarium graminearum PH-1]ESU15924.1 hypothetical protein FGSG_13567 [Fusarium graminearum PH-1]CEF82935.1 unnamed protein product [Fusarium graminearum]|eukprot:XP_011328392.1 hypothetical protein FGSG_13567 [Fusarium graminearum PH-1]